MFIYKLHSYNVAVDPMHTKQPALDVFTDTSNLKGHTIILTPDCKLTLFSLGEHTAPKAIYAKGDVTIYKKLLDIKPIQFKEPFIIYLLSSYILSFLRIATKSLIEIPTSEDRQFSEDTLTSISSTYSDFIINVCNKLGWGLGFDKSDLRIEEFACKSFHESPFQKFFCSENYILYYAPKNYTLKLQSSDNKSLDTLTLFGIHTRYLNQIITYIKVYNIEINPYMHLCILTAVLYLLSKYQYLNTLRDVTRIFTSIQENIKY